MMAAKKEIKKILLVFPSMLYKKTQSRKTAIFPLGLGHLASLLQNHNYNVRIIDSSLEGFHNEFEQENGLNCYGLSDEAYKKIFLDFQPDLVGVSGLFSSLHNQILRVAQLAKAVNPQIITVCGGPHASAVPERLLNDPDMDYCVVGEGETPLLKLIDCLRTGEDRTRINGLGFREQGKININRNMEYLSDLDQLPLPAWHLSDLEEYINIGCVQGLRMDGKKKKPLRLIQVTTSRGCPYQCTYCGKSATWGSGIRFMSANRVLEMLEYLLEKYQVERIAFQDDNLTLDQRRAKELFREMNQRKYPITWEAHNGLAFSTLDEEMLDLMKESGCVSFTGAVESGSEEVLKKIKKHVNLERAIELTHYAQSLGIDVRAFYIIGFPGETREQIEATRRHMRRLQASVSAMALFTPLPGSPLFKELEEQGILNSNTIDFETLSFGAFNLQMSEVPVANLHRIRKIDWLMNVFADAGGNLKENLPMQPEIITQEIQNGLQIYPDSHELRNLMEQIKSNPIYSVF